MTNLFDQALFTNVLVYTDDYFFVVLLNDLSLALIIGRDFLTVKQTCTRHLYMNFVVMLLQLFVHILANVDKHAGAVRRSIHEVIVTSVTRTSINGCIFLGPLLVDKHPIALVGG